MPSDWRQAAADRQAEIEALDASVYCCASTGCLAGGCGDVMDAIRSALDDWDLSARVRVVPTGCMGLCSLGPLIRLEVRGQAPVLYHSMNALLGRLVVAEHLTAALKAVDAGEPYTLPGFLTEHTLDLDLPFFTRQERIVLSNNGYLDPEKIEDYLARGGYEGLARAVSMPPEEVIEIIRVSDLRGRGGAGYPTFRKWTFCREAAGEEKFVICNGDEGDPGAYMDRSILEGDPHAVLEGMAIAAWAIGAQEGWFYIRAEYPLAIERVERAIRQARRYGLLGKDVLGSGMAFDCQIRLGAGAFVCGEETALIHSVEGLRGTPRPRPPYPSVHGLWGAPTCVNNVETLANVPRILTGGAEPFASTGTETSKGTKVFALTGKIRYSGLIEVPMGMSLREIIEDLGGGHAAGGRIKAVQTGGPSGGVIPEAKLDVPVCYEHLLELGSMMGSGGMIAMDDDDDMVDVAAFYLGFAVEESCGKCAPCRIGTAQMLALLKKVLDREATYDDLDTLTRLGHGMQRASLCGLGQTAPNPVLSTMRYFEDEYLSRIIAFASATDERGES